MSKRKEESGEIFSIIYKKIFILKKWLTFEKKECIIAKDKCSRQKNIQR